MTSRASALRFGTDGVRAVANSVLTPEFALALGRAAARHLGVSSIVVGRDTRRSGPMLEAALVAGLTAEGLDVSLLGVCPTPTVAWESARTGAAGVVVSASHNPFADNGIKIFGPGGLKLDDAGQKAIEAALSEPRLTQESRATLIGDAVGAVRSRPDALEDYQNHIMASIGGRGLDGVTVVVDCANGAASQVGPATLRALGAQVEVIGATPDGININEGCGSTHLEALIAEVRRTGADLGVAFDGDADRVLAVDHAGELIDGDQILAMCAIDLAGRGELVDSTVVVTVMSNLGFRQGMARRGISVHETAVGDRHVLAAMEAGGYSLGGEQSGHIILRRLGTTGDGLLTAVHVVDLVARRKASLRELADEAMVRLPQVLRNVRFDTIQPGTVQPDLMEQLAPHIGAVEAALGSDGRVLVRLSGTEPLLRVMVEATEASVADAHAAALVAAAERIVS